MTSSPISNSEKSEGFAALHPTVQRWVHQQGWTSLHDAQERAIGHIAGGETDVVIAAATAAGKTEAAFLPIISNLLVERDSETPAHVDEWKAHDPWVEPAPASSLGIQVLYISPLKALINDQFDRLEQMCEQAVVPVHRWHGDVSGSKKQKMLKKPAGVLLITPESLEAMFVNRGTQVPKLFAGLRYVVVDELHSFLATPRGAQLQSLMNRVELAIRRTPPRIGLSATLGDLTAAASFLRPTAPEEVVVISSSSDGSELQLQLRGYVDLPPSNAADRSQGEVAPTDKQAIARHIYRHLRGQDNLVFANRRSDVEVFADLLATHSKEEFVPNEFWPHHGNLSKEMRETVEEHLKDRNRPATAICTSTLEMGIDLGTVASVAQIGPPPSVASLRQRLGRSGRRNQASVLRIYVSEDHIDERSHPIDHLRCNIVQSVAMVQLMLDRWLEAPEDPGYNYSTLIQQVLSTIAQHGGATAVELHRALCGPGPFSLVDQSRFVLLLRAMASAELIVQTSDGLLLHGPVGERHVNHYGFYTAFQTAQEWRLVAGGTSLGTVPITQPLYEGVLMIFAGRRWKVASIDTASRVVELTRSAGGTPPSFGGGGPSVSTTVRAQMAAVYESSESPPWLDVASTELLREGRAAWNRFGLGDTSVLAGGQETLFFPWVGDSALFTASLALERVGIEASVEGPAVQIVGVHIEELTGVLDQLVKAGPPVAEELSQSIENPEIDKWDWALDETLVRESASARLLDIDGAWRALSRANEDLEAVAGVSNSSATPPFVFAESDPASAPEGPIPPDDAASGFGPQRRSLLQQEFCVIDLETTGFSPRLGDRVVEIAVVRLRGDGTRLKTWSTLVNPERDVGPTNVHGISAADVIEAPRFGDVIGDLLELFDGAVLAAHNLRFDHQFLAAEFERSGIGLPGVPAVCTLSLAAAVMPSNVSRRLDVCCGQMGIELINAHTAAADADAAAQLLVRYLHLAGQRGSRTLADIGCTPLGWPQSWPHVAPSRRIQKRGSLEARIRVQGEQLADLVGGLGGPSDGDPDVAAYTDLLDRALEDRRLTESESLELAKTAQDWGLSEEAVQQAHEAYAASLFVLAAEGGRVSEMQAQDLRIVASLLDLDADKIVETATRHNAPGATSTRSQLSGIQAGKSVCFSGTLQRRLGNAVITRAQAHALSEAAGLVVRSRVTKDLDMLVVADPDTQSGKAAKARALGVRIVAEQVFWSGLSSAEAGL